MNMIVYSFQVEIQLQRLFRTLKVLVSYGCQLQLTNFTLVINELRRYSADLLQGGLEDLLEGGRLQYDEIMKKLN